MEFIHPNRTPGILEKGITFPAIMVILLAVLFCNPLYSQKYKEIEVDLTSGIFKEYLPFDTHFLIKGTAPKDITEITAWYLEKKKSEVGMINISPFDECGILKERWHKIEPSWKRSELSGDKFYILAPPLKAKKCYQFYFQYTRPLEKEELEQFRGNLISSFDRVMRKKDKIDTLSKDDISQLQEKLNAALPDSNSNMKIIPVPGSIFDTCEQGFESFRKKVGSSIDLLNPQIERTNIIKEFNDKNSKAGNCLDRFRGNPILLAIHSVIQLNIKKYKFLYGQDNLAFRLVNRSRDELLAIARGDKPFDSGDVGRGKAGEKISNIWLPAECEERIQNLQGLRTSLGEIYSLLNSVLVNFTFFRQQHSDIQRKADIKNLMQQISDCQDIIDGQQHLMVRLKTELTAREEQIINLADQIEVLARTGTFAAGSSWGEFKTRASWYISPDIGLLYAPNLKEAFPYFGVNIYLRPVNRDVPLGMKDSLGRRFALMVGITTRSLEEEDRREDLIGSKSLVVGAGFRLTDFLRLSGGSLLYYKINSETEESQKKITASYFISLSLDWDIKSTIGMLGDALIGK